MARPVYWTKEILKELAVSLNDFFEKALSDFKEKTTNDLPFITSFCREFKISHDHFLDKANEKTKENEMVNPELFDAYKKSKQIQKEILILGGLGGRFNPTAFIFTAKNVTDMRDQAVGEKDNPFYFGEEVQPEQMERFMKRHGKNKAH